jgi:hypothetical protein
MSRPRLSGTLGGIYADLPHGRRAHVEVDLWFSRDGKKSWMHTVRLQVAKLRGLRAARILGLL